MESGHLWPSFCFYAGVLEPEYEFMRRPAVMLLSYRRILGVLVTCFVFLIRAQADQSVSLAWDASPDTNVVGYFLYYGTASGTYSSKINAGGNTTATATNLALGTTYFFAATAYDAVGDESVPSNEISYAVPTNGPPVLTRVTDQVITIQQPLCITNSAVDSYQPSGNLTFSLDPGAPEGMYINPTNGVLYWCPTWAQAGTTNLITVRVSDSSVPPLSAARTFTVSVGNAIQPTLGSLVVSLSQPGGSAVAFVASCPVTSLSFVLDSPAGWAGNLTVQSALPQSVVVSQYPPGAIHSLVTLRMVDGSELPAGQPIARISFAAQYQMGSNFGWLNASRVAATQTDGQPVPVALGGVGEMVFVGLDSLVEARMGSNGLRNFVVYGPYGSSYMVESTTNLNGQVIWHDEYSLTMTGLSQLFLDIGSNEPIKFYRARRLKQHSAAPAGKLVPITP
jgi:hypothetical protein